MQNTNKGLPFERPAPGLHFSTAPNLVISARSVDLNVEGRSQILGHHATINHALRDILSQMSF